MTRCLFTNRKCKAGIPLDTRTYAYFAPRFFSIYFMLIEELIGSGRYYVETCEKLIGLTKLKSTGNKVASKFPFKYYFVVLREIKL